jgi:hypothetical protein
VPSLLGPMETGSGEWKITKRSSSLLSLANFCYVDGLAGWKLVGDFIGGS